MCTVITEVCEVKVTIGLVESGCGGVNVGPPGASVKQEGSETSTPKKPTLELPRRVKEEEEDEDDPLNDLANLFSVASLDDHKVSDDKSSDDSDSDDGESDSGEDESDEDKLAPRSPRSKGWDKFYFYTASGRIHFYDSYRNVYLEDGTFVHNGSFDFQANELLGPSFYLDGTPFQFDLEGLWSSDVNGTPYRVLTWQDDPALLNLDEYSALAMSPQTDTFVSQPNPNPESYYGLVSAPMSMPAPDGYRGTPKTKAEAEALSPSVNPNRLQQGLKNGPKPLMWSPTSSTMSVIAPGSREPSQGPPLFDTQSTATQSIDQWRIDLVKVQQNAAMARPVKKSNKVDRRRCPECNKIFRRPSSLDDHLNVHTGAKPHTCPFKGCNTGFATKSNMKRHFLTHKAGPLERFRPGTTVEHEMGRQPMKTKSGKAARPISTYNSKSYHNGRFRISAEAPAISAETPA